MSTQTTDIGRWAVQFIDALAVTVERFAEIQLPVFTIHGDDDNICPLEGSRLLHAKISSTVHCLKVIQRKYPYIYILSSVYTISIFFIIYKIYQ